MSHEFYSIPITFNVRHESQDEVFIEPIGIQNSTDLIITSKTKSIESKTTFSNIFPNIS